MNVLNYEFANGNKLAICKSIGMINLYTNSYFELELTIHTMNACSPRFVQKLLYFSKKQPIEA